MVRSNKPGYRQKALLVIEHALEKNKSVLPELFCLYGRIYKDEYIESLFEDRTALQHAINGYRKAFKIQPNLHAGINLATLLLVDGNEFSKSEELQHIGSYMLILFLLIDSTIIYMFINGFVFQFSDIYIFLNTLNNFLLCFLVFELFNCLVL